MSVQIHPTAIVDEQVQFGSNVTVGPFCILEGDITLGDNCRLLANVHMKGPLTIGADCRFYPHSCIGYDPQDRGFDPDTPGAGTVLGERNVFREGVTIHRATKDHPTSLGSDNMLMSNSHIGHDSQLGSHITMANSALVAGHVHVGDGVFIGGNAGIHQFCKVGRLVMISGQRGVLQDVPPFCNVLETRTITGLNRVGLRRAGLRRSIKNLERAFEILFLSNQSNPVGIEQVRRELSHCPLCQEMADFVATSTRGIARHFNRKHMMSAQDFPD